MLKEELYRQYLQWKKGKIAWSIEEMFGFPKVDCDVYENEDVLVSRLFYVIPDIFEVKLRVFIFYDYSCLFNKHYTMRICNKSKA